MNAASLVTNMSSNSMNVTSTGGGFGFDLQQLINEANAQRKILIDQQNAMLAMNQKAQKRFDFVAAVTDSMIVDLQKQIDSDQTLNSIGMLALRDSFKSISRIAKEGSGYAADNIKYIKITIDSIDKAFDTMINTYKTMNMTSGDGGPDNVMYMFDDVGFA